jgi:hypothetical protein
VSQRQREPSAPLPSALRAPAATRASASALLRSPDDPAATAALSTAQLLGSRIAADSGTSLWGSARGRMRASTIVAKKLRAPAKVFDEVVTIQLHAHSHIDSVYYSGHELQGVSGELWGGAAKWSSPAGESASHRLPSTSFLLSTFCPHSVPRG